MRATRLILIVAVVVAVTLPLAAYNLPSITSIAPSAVPAGSGSFTLTVSGSYFNGRDKITWNGVRLTTTLVSLTQAQAVVPANYVASAGNANVAIWDSRSGTFSSAVTFTITAGTPVGVSIAPGSSALSPGSPQQFTAAVSGTTNTAVTWSASGGTISSTGLYTAPSAVSTARVLPDAVGPSPAGASVGHGSTVSWLHTASGSNRLVTVGCSLGKLDIPPFTLSATYGGISMLSDPVSLRKVNARGDGAVQMFYLAAPPTGQQTVMVTLSGTTADLECGSVSFTGVDQLTPLRHTATSTGYSSTPSITISSAIGDMVVNTIDYGCSGGSSAQTLAWMKQINCSTGGSNGAQSIAAGAASVGMNYLIANDQWGMVAADIAAAASANTSAAAPSANTPAAAPSANSYTVTATSVADPTKSASAVVTVSTDSSPVVSVSVSPTTATVTTGGTQQFTADVSGTTNTAVAWSASGGTVSSAGLYTAPNTAGNYVVTATSAADATKSASASVSVSAPVTVSVSVAPTSATVTTGGTQQFTAIVSGSTNTAVTWSATAGTVSSTGLYTAPGSAGTYTVKATSAADPTKSASASVSVSAAVTVSVSVAPTSTTTTTNGTAQFTATVSGSTNTAVTWSATAGTVSSTGLYTAPGTAGTYTVTATSAADTTKSASASVSVSAAVTVSVSVAPTSTTMTTGGTQQFAATVSGSTNTAVTWSATAGTVSSTGLYTAPSTAGTYTVKATSAADPTKSASATATVTAPVSVSLTPNNTTMTTNGTVQFTATVTGSTNTAVTWSVASGSGTVSTNGLYTAPSTAGTASVVATSVADPRSSALANITINAPVTVLLSASPTSVAFGSVLVGGSGSHALTLSNTGNSAVTVSSASFTGSGFGLSGITFPFTLAAAASKNGSLTFAPSSSGTASGSVSFVSNATNSPATVALSGSGTTPVQHTATLNWQASGSSVTGFNIYRSTNTGGSYTRMNSTTSTTPSYADSSVQSGQTYYYVVTQLDNTGMESGYSSQVTAVIPTP